MIDPKRPCRRHLFYLAGPIMGNGGNVPMNIEIARRIGQELCIDGWSVFIPHTNNGEIEGFGLPEYLALDFEVLSRCDGIALLPGWELSEGTRAEVDFSAERGKQQFTVAALIGKSRVRSIVEAVRTKFGEVV